MTLKQLAFDSKASQEGWEMWQILKQVAELRPKNVVEIGVDGGGSLYTWHKALKPELLIGVDINDKSDALNENLAKIEAEGGNVRMLFADSQAEETIGLITDALGGKFIDFLWLDGDHHYDAVKTEFQYYAPLVRPGGIIGFHDTNSRGIEGVEVERFMKELDEKMGFRTADFRLNSHTPGSRLIWR